MLNRFIKLLIVISFFTFLFFPTVIYADNNDDINDEDIEDKTKGHLKGAKDKEGIEPKDIEQGGVTLESKRYPMSHYFPIVNADGSWWPFSSENISKGINSISTGLFAMNKQLSEIVDASLDRFLTLNVIKRVQEIVTDSSETLWNTMKKHFVPILLIIAVSQIFIYYISERNGNKAGKTVLRLLLIIVVAFIWIANSGYYLKVLNHWSSQAQGYMMSAGTVLTNDIDEIEEGNEIQGSAALLRNSFFQMTVRRPYLVMNYGTTNEEDIQEKAEEGENRIENMLALKTNEGGSKARDDIAKEEVDKKGNSYMDQGSVWSKFGISILSILFTLFLGIPLFVLVFFNVLVQFIVLMIAFILPISFVVSILPIFANSGWHSLGRLISTFLMKMFIGILILFVFMIFNIVDVLLPPDSVGVYYLNMTLSAFLMTFMIIKRDKIVEFITAGRVVSATGQVTAGMYNGARRSSNMARNTGSHAASKGLTTAAAGLSLASFARRGIDKIRNRGENRTSQGIDNKQEKNGDQTTASNGSVVNLAEYRKGKGRTSQGKDNDESGSNEDDREQSVHDENSVQIPKTQENAQEASRHEGRNIPNGDQNNDEESIDQDNITYRQYNLEDREHARTYPAQNKKDNTDKNPQTSGEVKPSKKLTKWEAQKQVENQREKGIDLSGRQQGNKHLDKPSRTNRTPQDGRLEKQDRKSVV